MPYFLFLFFPFLFEKYYSILELHSAFGLAFHRDCLVDLFSGTPMCGGICACPLFIARYVHLTSPLRRSRLNDSPCCLCTYRDNDQPFLCVVPSPPRHVVPISYVSAVTRCVVYTCTTPSITCPLAATSTPLLRPHDIRIQPHQVVIDCVFLSVRRFLCTSISTCDRCVGG